MLVLTLFPGGVYQLYDVLQNGYWHARTAEFQLTGPMHVIEWLRLPADAVFIVLGVVPLVIAALRTYLLMFQPPALKRAASAPRSATVA